VRFLMLVMLLLLSMLVLLGRRLGRRLLWLLPVQALCVECLSGGSRSKRVLRVERAAAVVVLRGHLG
jgi:cell division inhibitor SulA